jgi:hypothetical protein
MAHGTQGLGRATERALRHAVVLLTLVQRCAVDSVLMLSQNDITGAVLRTCQRAVIRFDRGMAQGLRSWRLQN